MQNQLPADKSLLKRVEQRIHSVLPNAIVILYGSRARGESGQFSDWDFLILVDGSLDRSLIVELKNSIYDLELETDTVLSSIVRTREEWNSSRYAVLPFRNIVEQEGIRL